MDAINRLHLKHVPFRAYSPARHDLHDMASSLGASPTPQVRQLDRPKTSLYLPKGQTEKYMNARNVQDRSSYHYDHKMREKVISTIKLFFTSSHLYLNIRK